MRQLIAFFLLLAICLAPAQASADACQDAVDEHNETAEDDQAWFKEALQQEFGVSEWSDIDWSAPRACERILPIYREQLSRAEVVLSLHQEAARLCRNLRTVGDGTPTEERISIIRKNIQLCEESDSDTESGTDEASGGESEEKFKAAQELAQKQSPPSAPPSGGTNSGTGGYRRSANCSDITGTGGGGSGGDCPEPKQREFAALPPEKGSAASGKPTPPAESKPGIVDRLTGLAGSIVDALGSIRSGQKDSPASSSGASLPPDFDPSKFDSYHTGTPPQLLKEGDTCRRYFRRMVNVFSENAALCLRDARLMRSLADMIEKDGIRPEEIVITRNTAPELYSHFDPQDRRWTKVGETLVPVCTLPLTVASQSESYLECARAYLCGARAARCGVNRSQESSTKDCLPISQACIAENPIPQRMTEASPPPYVNSSPGQPQPKGPPPSKSTITGPSGRGDGGGSGGVMPAR